MSRKISCTPVGCGVLVVLFFIGSIVNACSPQVDTTQSPTPEYSASAEPSATPTDSASPTPTEPAAATGGAMALLDTLPVEAMGPQTGYDREANFGPSWFDVDSNGCDTRNDILRRDFEAITNAESCLIYNGVIDDPYTGVTITFQRGRGTSNAVQIDHMVALSDAWKTGAANLSFGMRVALANDPINLVAVDGPTNGAKSDSDAAWWLPPNRSVWCWYVAHQVSVKAAYHLWVTPDEKVAMTQVLTTCPTQEAFATDYPARVAAGTLHLP